MSPIVWRTMGGILKEFLSGPVRLITVDCQCSQPMMREVNVTLPSLSATTSDKGPQSLGCKFDDEVMY